MTGAGDGTVRVGLPGDTSYQAATAVFNLAAPPRPAAAVTARTVDDVRAALRYAESRGLAVRVHATGHAAAAVPPIEGCVLIRTAMTGSVQLDAARRLARVPAGTCWGAVVDAAAAHELAAPHGSSPLVGVIGYLLRGGVSLYGRQVGLAANSVRAIELVTADGALRRVDAFADPELFWALRGGGGGFGVVTSVEVELFPVASVVTGAAYWPAERASDLLAAWQQWTRSAPSAATTTLRLMNLPALPEIPPALSAGQVLCIDGAVLAPDGDAALAQRQADELLGPLRALGTPLLDTWCQAAAPAVAQAHMEPTEPFPIYGDHMLLDELGEDGIAELLRVAGPRSGSVLTNVELRQLGGALSASSPSGGVLDHLQGRFACMSSGVPFGDVTPQAIMTRCDIIRAALSRWDTGRTVPTFVERVAQPQGHLSHAQISAVDRVRKRVDPAGRFRADIAPSASELR